VPYHVHECAALIYGVGGPCLEYRPDGEVIKRRLTYHPAGYGHSLRYCGPTHVLAIEIGPSQASGLDDEWPTKSTPLPASLYDLVWHVIIAVAANEGQDQTRQALEILLQRTQEAIGRESGSSWLGALIEELHRSWSDVPSASRLARQFSVSRQHLCRAFKAATGVTLREYSLLLRLDYARGLLWGSRLSISEVAASTGFADQSHLTRVLAKHSRKTPLRFRWAAPCPRIERIALSADG
jgi:AraC-like DNA-binding protein